MWGLSEAYRTSAVGWRKVETARGFECLERNDSVLNAERAMEVDAQRALKVEGLDKERSICRDAAGRSIVVAIGVCGGARWCRRMSATGRARYGRVERQVLKFLRGWDGLCDVPVELAELGRRKAQAVELNCTSLPLTVLKLL